MINFDDLGKKLNETVESFSSLAGKGIEIQKLKNQIRNLERGNDHDMESLGRIIYQDFLDGVSVDEKVVELCEAIKSREEGINDALNKINVIKGEFVCPACGKPVAKEMSFCPHCGAKLPDFAELEAEVAEECAEAEAEAEASDKPEAEAADDAHDSALD